MLKVTEQQFTSAGIALPQLRIRDSQESQTPTDVILRKEDGRITALINQNWPWFHLRQNGQRLAAYVYWFSCTSDDVREIVVDASDGNLPSAARYKYAVTSQRQIPLPDAHFFRDRGYVETDRFASDHAPAWGDRQDQIVWRGGLNGVGLFSLDPATADAPGVIQRLRMALKCQDLGIDFRFIFDTDQPFCHVLQTAGLTGDYMPTHDWGGMKYAIDIDGYTNAWCNFMRRLKLGCCVLKVDSPFGYYQWYYHKLIPWEHYVPIRADLSDLAEQIDWALTNTGQAREIAAHGQAFAKNLTFESERDIAVQTIEDREQQA